MRAGRFVVTTPHAVVGHARWPWDDLYVPVVGCFVGGALQATAECGRLLSELQPPPPTLRRRSRLKRRVMRELGLTPPPLPMGDTITLSGPDAPVWFHLNLPPEVVARLRADDPAVRIERLEDSAPVTREGAEATAVTGAFTRVEELLNEPETVSGDRLDGFAAFLASPPQHQFEMVFVEYLRRMPEAGAREGYLLALARGDIGILDLRRSILDSEEFRGRRVGYGSKLGAALTSPLWREFARLPNPLTAPPASGQDMSALAA